MSLVGSFGSSARDWKDNRHDGSTTPPGSIKGQGQANMSKNLAPLQVHTSRGNNNNDGEEAAMRATDLPESSDNAKVEPLSSKSEKFIAGRVEELSQLSSPQLRELAFTLGNMLNIQTPKYKPERSFVPPHLEIKIGHRWQVLQGCNNWRGKLDPIDRDLKAEIIRYGEFAQATYDAFDENSDSPTCGESLFDKESLLESLELTNRGYEITDFIYAATKFNHLHTYLTDSFGSSSSESSVGDHHAQRTSRQSNWIGFVAVCTSPDEILRLGRRDIVIAWRGTCTVNEFLADISDYMSPIGFGPESDSPHVRVQAGFYKVYTSKNPYSRHNKTSSARDQVMQAVKTLVEKYKGEGKLSITLAGHSLGSALATLCAYDIAESGFNLLSDSPSAPHRWSSVDSRPGAKSHEDTSHIQHSHLDPVKSLIHPVHHHDKEDEDILVQHPKTAGVRNFFHSKLHHSKEGGHRMVQGMKNIYGNKEEAEIYEFPPGKIPITVYSFAGPRVGNRNFRERVRDLGVAVLRIVNVHDLVPELPGLKHISWAAAELHKIIPHFPSYKHVGVKLEVDNSKSAFLKDPASPWQAHSLDAYLHLVDVYLGRNHYAGPLEKTFRDYALVNRKIDFLKPEFYIPPFWKFVKEVARDCNGTWVFPGRTEATVPKASNAEDEFADFWQKVDAAAAAAKV